MAEVDVKKSQKDEKAVAGQGGKEPTSRQDWEPTGWWRTPSEFFSEPFSVMRRFREEMDRVFSRTLGEEHTTAWSPAIEVAEREGKLEVHAELAGLKPEDVKIEITDDSLIIQGERKYEYEEKNKGRYRSERRYGRFYRTIPLPEGANTDQAKAEFSNGVLEIKVPVPERKSNRREIPIGSGSGQKVPTGAQTK
jgi:HSP20 family protein